MAATRVTLEELISVASKNCPQALRLFEKLSARNKIRSLSVRQPLGEQDAIRDMIHIAAYDFNSSSVYAGLKDAGGIQLYRQKQGESFVEPIAMDLCFPEGHPHVKAFVSPFDMVTSLAGKPPKEPTKSVVVRELRRHRLTISVVYQFLSTKHVRDVILTNTDISEVQKDFQEVCVLVQLESSKSAKRAANNEAVKESQPIMQQLQGSNVHQNREHYYSKQVVGQKRKTSSEDQIDNYEPASEQGPLRKHGPSDRFIGSARSGLRKKDDNINDGPRGTGLDNATGDNGQVAIPIRPSPGPSQGGASINNESASGRRVPLSPKGKATEVRPTQTFMSSMNEHIAAEVQRQVDARIAVEVDDQVLAQKQKTKKAEQDSAHWKAQYKDILSKYDDIKSKGAEFMSKGAEFMSEGAEIFRRG